MTDFFKDTYSSGATLAGRTPTAGGAYTSPDGDLNDFTISGAGLQVENSPTARSDLAGVPGATFSMKVIFDTSRSGASSGNAHATLLVYDQDDSSYLQIEIIAGVTGGVTPTVGWTAIVAAGGVIFSSGGENTQGTNYSVEIRGTPSGTEIYFNGVLVDTTANLTPIPAAAYLTINCTRSIGGPVPHAIIRSIEISGDAPVFWTSFVKSREVAA